MNKQEMSEGPPNRVLARRRALSRAISAAAVMLVILWFVASGTACKNRHLTPEEQRQEDLFGGIIVSNPILVAHALRQEPSLANLSFPCNGTQTPVLQIALMGMAPPKKTNDSSYIALPQDIAGQEAVVRALVHGGTSVNAVTRGRSAGVTALEVAVTSSAPLTVIKFLVANGAYVNPPAAHAGSPLCRACRLGRLGAAEYLVSKGANVNLASVTGTAAAPPLVTACEGGPKRQIAVVRFLLANGANPNGRDSNGMSGLMLAARQPGRLSLLQAVLDAGGSVDARSRDGATALIWAAKASNLAGVKLLLAAGANPAVRDSHGRSALDAARSGPVRELLTPAAAHGPA